MRTANANNISITVVQKADIIVSVTAKGLPLNNICFGCNDGKDAAINILEIPFLRKLFIILHL